MGRGLSWRRLGVLVEALATTPGTRLYAELTGSDWTRPDLLTALIADHLAVANWQRQGKKGAKRPDPVSPQAKGRKSADRVGDAAGRSPEEIKALLAANRNGADRG